MFQHEEHVEYRLGSFQSLSLISLGNVSYFWMFVAAGVCSFQLCICTPVIFSCRPKSVFEFLLQTFGFYHVSSSGKYKYLHIIVAPADALDFSAL